MSSESKVSALVADGASDAGSKTVFKVLLAISFCHLLNDTVQSLLPAIYPLLRDTFHLDFGQIGLISFTSTFTASLLQPLVGLYSDGHHKPYFLAIGMAITLIGLVTLSLAPSYATVLVAAALVGMGSSVFHPESSRVARMASGGQHGMAQSLFQVGGNAGSALGPLLATFVLPRGQRSIAWFSFVALLGIVLLARIGAWAKRSWASQPKFHMDEEARKPVSEQQPVLPGKKIAFCMGILVALMFSKYFYLASLMSYYTFYLMHKLHVSLESALLHLFVFLAVVAAGTIIGGPVGDRVGRKYVI